MRVLVFGDSIVRGASDTECGGWANRLGAYTCAQSELQDDYSQSIHVLGIDGDCTNRLLERFENEATTRLKNKSGAIIFSVGINDTQRWVADGSIKTTEEQFEKNILTLIEQAKTLTNQIVFVGLLPIVENRVQPMPWADDRSHYTTDAQKYNAIIEKICLSEGLTFIPMQDVLGHNYPNLMPDGIHPNTEGHRLVFEHVRDALVKENIV